MHFRKLIALLLVLFMMAGFPIAHAEEAPAVLSSSRPEVYYAASSTTPLRENKELRDHLADALTRCVSEVSLESFKIKATQANVDAISELIFYEIPEAFHYVGGGFYYNSSNYLTQMEIYYLYDAKTYTPMYNACKAAAQKLTAGLEGLGDVEKALLLHDRLALHCEYSVDDLTNGTYDDNDFTIYGALVEQMAVCQGYAFAYEYLLDLAGIESTICSSEDLNHAWNIVTIGRVKYHVDVTWDDPVEDITGQVYHDNFLISSTALYNNGHKASDYDTSPTATTYDQAFWRYAYSSFQLVKGELYYIDSADFAIRRYSDQATIHTIDQKWTVNSFSFSSCYARLATDGKNLIYSLPGSIYWLELSTGKTMLLHQATLETGFQIYGFDLQGTTMIIEPFDYPVFEHDTKKTYQFTKPYADPAPKMTDAVKLLRRLAGERVVLSAYLLDRNNDDTLTIADTVLLLRELSA
ncbi:MAG: hypothetical protein IJ043_00420 [Clostridia bacterium]|nr:hypothetical protein [Clostridia bacterium]